MKQYQVVARPPSRPRQGIIFVTALWVIIVLVAIVLIFAQSMRVEIVSASNRLATQQASTIELGAEQYVLSAVDGCGGNATSVLQTPAEQLPLGDGYFWILQTDATDDRTYAFGITDECSKCNINVTSVAGINALPGMTEDVADSIIDWRDSDEKVTGEGAESAYYGVQSRPYSSKNAAFETPEELYLVKGMTDTLMWGSDLDHNGVIDDAESAAGGLTTQFNSAVDDSRGLFPFVTVWGVEPNTTATGKKRTNISNLGDTSAQSAVRSLLQSKKFSKERVDQIIAKARAARIFRNALDFAVKTGLTPTEFASIEDNLTATPATTLKGMININTASEQVLMCLPSISPIDADAIIAARPTTTTGTSTGTGISTGSGSSSGTQTAWLLSAIRPNKAAAIGGLITGKSYFYSADIVAVARNARAFKRIRIMVDARQSPPMIVYRKDLTYLGWPLLPDIRTALQHNAPLPGVSGNGTGGANGLTQSLP